MPEGAKVIHSTWACKKKGTEMGDQNEYNCMVKNQVFEEVNKSDLSEGTNVIDGTWVYKKK